MTSKKASVPPATDKKRVTFVIPATLDQGIEFYCAGTGKTKNEAATTALAEFIHSRRADMMKVLERATELAGPR
jgi:hypothetical protein